MQQLRRPTTKTSLHVSNGYEGETIEEKVRRIVSNGEPISDGAPLIYTERKDGVQPDYDPRADKWDVAIEAMGIVAKTNTARRNQGIGERTYDTMTTEQQNKFNSDYPQNRHAIAAKKPQNSANNG